MPRHLSRGAFLGAALAAAAAPRALAAAPSDLDLANARLLVAIELLLADFYSRLPKSRVHTRAAFNEREHLAAVGQILTDSGQTPVGADDIDFTYPARSFASEASRTRLGWTLEHLALGAYLGAIDSTQSQVYRLVFARIAANEAEHLTAFRPFANSFADVLTIEQASDALGEYTG
jgi:Ferritin-like domain